MEQLLFQNRLDDSDLARSGHIVDDFRDAASWIAVASGQAKLARKSERTPDGIALRLDFDFRGGGGFVGIRKNIAMRLPESFAFLFRIRGAAPRNKLEFKLADAGGRNVWRWQQEAFDFRRKARGLFLKSSEIEFAWGPAGGGALRRLGSVEFIISAGPGGCGTVWIEDFRFINRTSRKPVTITASSNTTGFSAESVMAKKQSSGWRSSVRDSRPWLQLDFHQAREYGGLIIDWTARPAKRSFEVHASDSARKWRRLYRSRGAEGARSFVYLPQSESRFLRLAFGGPVEVRRIEIQPFEFSRSLVDFAHGVAERSPPGHFPRYLLREQSYWTCSGVSDGLTCALINEEGMVEPDKGTFSLEPFLHVAGNLVTWADARCSVGLEKDGLAIPWAHWALRGLALEVKTFATGHRADAVQFIRYRIKNEGRGVREIKLFIALRPYQVTPPWQAWNGLGGLSAIKEIGWKHGAAVVNGSKWVVPLSECNGFGAVAFEQSDISEYLAHGRLPRNAHARDQLGLASGAMQFDVKIAGGETRDVFVAAPYGFRKGMGARQLRRFARVDGAVALQEAVEATRARVGNVSFEMPAGPARQAALTFRTAAGQILIDRDGPALQPGPRRYTRSWIRDGVVMGAALLRIGDQRALPEFVRWFARFQRKDGFVPCCVDRSGPDWLVEHDSHGQFIYGVMESFHFTRDREFLKEMWPHVRKAARYLGKLRALRLTAEYKRPEKAARYGLLPESASHEGYLAHPVHSYWDDAWGLRGMMDAAAIAAELGHERDAREFGRSAESFRETFSTSVRAVIAAKKLDYVPASVEWADFDPTATSNTITLLQGIIELPPKQLEGMCDKFLRGFRAKHFGNEPWNNYTAYEIRIIGALVRIGKRAEALELLKFFLADRRPLQWNQWPEISWRNPRSPGHLGDVPHTWIAAEYMLAFASLFAYEREVDDALVIGAGLAPEWLAAKGGVSVRGLPTWYGALDLTMKCNGNSLFLELGGELRSPRGGFVVRPPTDRAICSLAVHGLPASTFSAREVIINKLPARAVIEFDNSRAAG